MARTLTLAGSPAASGAADIAAALEAGSPFWLDIEDPTAEDHALLRDRFGFHPLAVEDAEDFGQRAKLDTFDDFVFLVAYGVAGGHQASPGAALVEVHFFLSESFLVTVHRGPNEAISAAAARPGGEAAAPLMVLYRVFDELADSFFPYLEAFDDAIDELQDDILRTPTNAQLGRLFDLKRELIRIRRVTADERDMLGTALTGAHALPGITLEAERYLRDVHDHLSRLAQLADGYRDLLSSALDTHLSTTSNRLNVVMKQLAIIATVFLPMSFLTGFFGQNFGWLVDQIGGSVLFWTLGVGLQALIAAGLLIMFRTMGWLGDKD